MVTRSSITFNYRIVDEHIKFPYCMQLSDNSNEQSSQLESAVSLEYLCGKVLSISGYVLFASEIHISIRLVSNSLRRGCELSFTVVILNYLYAGGLFTLSYLNVHG